MSKACGLNGALYADGTQYTASTTLSISLTRSVSEVQIQQQEYTEKCVGPYSGDFSGSGVIDNANKDLLGYVTTGASKSVAIYPEDSTSNYWSFTGYFTGWSVDGPVDGFWTVDFEGIIDGALSTTGFS